MYDAAVDRSNVFCLCQQTSVRRDELYEQPVPGAERREMVAPPPGHHSPPTRAVQELKRSRKTLQFGILYQIRT